MAQQDSQARVDDGFGADSRTLSVSSSDDGPQIVFGDDVLTAIDRGLAVAAFTPAGNLIGQWAFSLDEKPGVQLPPAPFVLSGESTCATLLPNRPVDVNAVLEDGIWWATVDGKGTAMIILYSGDPPATDPSYTWQHRVSSGRGSAAIDEGR